MHVIEGKLCVQCVSRVPYGADKFLELGRVVLYLFVEVMGGQVLAPLAPLERHALVVVLGHEPRVEIGLLSRHYKPVHVPHHPTLSIGVVDAPFLPLAGNLGIRTHAPARMGAHESVEGEGEHMLMSCDRLSPSSITAQVK
jgi:hypothetical protein